MFIVCSPPNILQIRFRKTLLPVLPNAEYNTRHFLTLFIVIFESNKPVHSCNNISFSLSTTPLLSEHSFLTNFIKTGACAFLSYLQLSCIVLIQSALCCTSSPFFRSKRPFCKFITLSLLSA